MAKIIDYSTEDNKVVGKIEDTGSYDVQDPLLEDYIEEYKEEGIWTIVPYTTNEGIEYHTGIVEEGQKGFAKAVLQHLPSPYNADKEQMIKLPDYVVREQEYDIETDEKEEEREYIDSPNEAPDDVEVYESDENDDVYFYYPSERGDASDEVTEEELREDVTERVRGKSGPGLAQEMNDIISDYIGEVDADTLHEVASDHVSWGDDSFVVAAKSALGDLTEFEGSQGSYNKPATREELDERRREFGEQHGLNAWRDANRSVEAYVRGLDMYEEETAPLWQVAALETGNERIYNGDEDVLLDYDAVDDEKKRAVDKAMQYDQEVLKEKFGDRIPVFRGFDPAQSTNTDRQQEETQNVIEDVKEGKDIEIEHSCAESWSTNPMEAYRFAGGDGIIVQDWMSPEESLISTASMKGFLPDQAEIIRMHEEDEVYDSDKQVMMSNDVNPLHMLEWIMNIDESVEKAEDESDGVVTIAGEDNQADWLRVIGDRDEKEKGGGMNTLASFIGQSSQTPGPSRAPIDEEYAQVENEEELPEPGTSTPDDINIIDLDEDVAKTRVYIDDRSEAPDWADVEEGPQGGLYYDMTANDTGEVHHPDSLNPADIETVTSMTDDETLHNENIATGASAEDMFLAFKENGEKVFMQKSESEEIAGEDSQKLHMTAKTAMDHMEVRAPNMNFVENYDEEGNDVLMMEHVGEGNSNRPAKMSKEVREKADIESLLEASCAKYLTGDRDLGGNIVLGEDGQFHPIDFDLAGSSLDTWKEYGKGDSTDEWMDELVSRIERVAPIPLDMYEIEHRDVKETMEDLASNVDIEELEETYGEMEEYDEEVGKDIKENIKDVQEGTLWQ